MKDIVLAQSPSSSERARQYRLAPIVDAIIEVRFTNEVTDDLKETASDKFQASYELKENVSHQQISVSISAESAPETNVQSLANLIKRSSLDQPRFVQIGNDLLNVAAGAPYKGWDVLFGDFKSAFLVCKKTWGFRPIRRIGVRFINRIDLPCNDEGIVDYEEYLNLRIKLPPEFPAINYYDLAFSTPLTDIRSLATIRSGVVQPAVPGLISFNLDIDLVCESEPPQREAELFEFLQTMRIKKNELFETFITDRARKVFEGVEDRIA